jgi:sugar O-acyltransferase (sialic acid O-acetyltransferase NeuD family)
MAVQPIDLVIFGASGFAREVAEWAERATWDGRSWRLVGFIDDVTPGGVLRDRPVLSLADTGKVPGAMYLVAVGDPKLRERLAGQAEAVGLRVAPPLVHPSVEYAREYVRVGDGTVICRGCTLTTDIDVGRHVQINLHCTVGHDVRLGDYATLAPGVHISGKVDIGRGAYFGTGAVTVDGGYDDPLAIGAHAIVGAGAVVTRDVPAAATVVGVPARSRP